jgi:hypothetical protein
LAGDYDRPTMAAMRTAYRLPVISAGGAFTVLMGRDNKSQSSGGVAQAALLP